VRVSAGQCVTPSDVRPVSLVAVDEAPTDEAFDDVKQPRRDLAADWPDHPLSAAALTRESVGDFFEGHVLLAGLAGSARR
jgi:hypothetical protein